MKRDQFIDLYAFRAMMKHLNSINDGGKEERRNREQRRVKVALRTINRWQKEGEEIWNLNFSKK